MSADEPPRHASGWPQRVVDVLGRPPRAGDWYAECCELDLCQIDAEDLQSLFELYSDFDTGGAWFPTEAAARASLAKSERSP